MKSVGLELHRPLWALGKSEEIVGMQPISFSLEILAAVVRCNHHSNFLGSADDIENPFPIFNPRYGLRYREFPAPAISIDSADVLDSFMRVGAVALVDTF